MFGEDGAGEFGDTFFGDSLADLLFTNQGVRREGDSSGRRGES